MKKISIKFTNAKTWITFVGLSPLAVINTIYLAIERDCFIPDTFIFFYTSKSSSNMAIIKSFIRYFENFLPRTIHFDSKRKIKEIELPESPTLKEYILLLSREIEMAKKNKFIVAIDITPGLKVMSIAAISAGINKGVDKIYYTYLKDRIYEKKFVLEIPSPLIELYTINKRGKMDLMNNDCDKTLFQVKKIISSE